MQHVQSLFLITAHFEFILKVAHIPGKQNIAAVATSSFISLPNSRSQLTTNQDPPGSGVSGDSPATGLAFSKLVPVIQQLLAAGVAPSTRRVYTCGALRYQEFSNFIGMEAYPTSERSLLLFVSFLFTENLAPSTIKTYLAVVRYEQIGRGLGDPSMAQMPQSEYAVKGDKQLSKLKKEKLPTHHP